MSGGLPPQSTPFYVKFAAGGIAGLIGSTFSAPADIIKVRMQASEGTERLSAAHHVKEVYGTWGLSGFLKGVAPTIVRAVVLNAVFLSTYDHIKHYLIGHRILSDGYANHFTSSMASGLCITLATSPFDVVKTRNQN